MHPASLVIAVDPVLRELVDEHVAIEQGDRNGVCGVHLSADRLERALGLLAGELMARIVAEFPGRPVHGVGDAACHGRPLLVPGATWTTRLPANAALGCCRANPRVISETDQAAVQSLLD